MDAQTEDVDRGGPERPRLPTAADLDQLETELDAIDRALLELDRPAAE